MRLSRKNLLKLALAKLNGDYRVRLCKKCNRWWEMAEHCKWSEDTACAQCEIGSHLSWWWYLDELDTP